MKKSSLKSKLPAVIACILFLFTTLHSCKKDNDQQEIISGTTWSWESESRDEFLMIKTYIDNNNGFIYDLYCNKIIISFRDSKANVGIAFTAHYVELDAWAGSQEFYALGPNASYTYKGKNINIKPEFEMIAIDLPEQIWTGTVNKNTMNLENVFGASVKLGKQ